MKKSLKAIVVACLALSLTLGTPEVALRLGVLCSSVSASAAAAAPQTPKASLKSGTYNVYAPKTVTLSCATKGTQIYYWDGGSAYKKYTGPISITKNCTLKFYSKLNGVKSEVVSCQYKLTPDVDISAPTGYYPAKVTFTTPLSGVTYYYTTDGTKPTTKSQKVTNNSLTIKNSCTLRVLAAKSGWSSKYYTVDVSAKKDDVKPGYLNDYTQKFYYKNLNAEEKAAYKYIYDALMNFEEKIPIEQFNLNYDQADKISHDVRYDNPQIFWCYTTVMAGYDNLATVLIPEYTMTKAQVQVRQQKLDSVAADYAAEAAKQPTEFMRIQYIHDRMLDKVSYYEFGDDVNSIRYVSEADRALIEGDAVCMGYSHAFTYLCQAAGIECFSESGMILNEQGEYGGHIWNKVKVGDGWYNIDPTWDDPIGGSPNYSCFFISNAELYKTHKTINGMADFNPKAPTNSTKFLCPNAVGQVTVHHCQSSSGQGS